MYKILCVITARGGSKGIPLKNISLLNKKPLIEYTIESAIDSNIFDNICISSDYKRIGSFAKKYNIEFIERPSYLSADNSRSIDAVLHVLQQYKHNGIFFDIVVLLQPTSPLRTHFHLQEALEKFIHSSCKSLFSISEAYKHPYKSFCYRNEILQPLFDKKFLSKPRQDLPRVFNQNGAIYINYTLDLIEHKDFFIEPVIGYEMSQIDSLDIDTELDLKIAEFYLKNQ